MKSSTLLATAAALCSALPLAAQPVDMEARILPPRTDLGPVAAQYVAVDAPVVAFQNAKVIDGTGAPAEDGRTIVISDGVIQAYGGADVPIPDGAEVLDLTGKTVMPGFVGMHDHLFYIARPNLKPDGSFEGPGVLAPQMSFSAPRMYLAMGVTTLRTAGSLGAYTDLNLKADIDAGLSPGPHLDVSGPYLEGPPGVTIQQHRLTGPEDARKLVDYWADLGVTSFKAYEHISHDALQATIEAAHARGIKVTAHLCSVSYPEAIAMGIDNIEHSFFQNSQLAADRDATICPPNAGLQTLIKMPPGSEARADLIADLVEADVALTSTLGVHESYSINYSPLSEAALDTLAPGPREDYLALFAANTSVPEKDRQVIDGLWQSALAMEREFVAAGGLLMAGSDSTGSGQMLPGFGNHRTLALHVSAGFTAEEAVQIATRNGAKFLGLEHRIGSIAEGMNADLAIIDGDPTVDIAQSRNVEIVFKDGRGYDSAALLAAVRGKYGRY